MLKFAVLSLAAGFLLIQTQARNVHPHKNRLGHHGFDAGQKLKEETQKFELKTPDDILGINQGSDEKETLKEGDIKQTFTRNTINSETNPAALWTTKNIPITFSNRTTLEGRAAIDEARQEYELRTCLSFPERTNEEDYLIFDRYSGCWSWVGVQGGGQEISIGPGCEHMSVVQHEVMHAIGIWHEQSRADRDDYIEIVYDAISPDLAYNFNNYDFNLTDDRRIPYDFDSVMHYGKTAFSQDGNITIRTRNTAFQDVIGQYSTFSEGDVTKINRMYDCSDTLRISNSVNFEEDNAGGYSGDNSDAPWLRHILGTSHVSGPTTKYLPKFDSTNGVEGEGSFMYLDTSSRYPGLTGGLKSMRYTTTVARQCLEFSHYINLDENSAAYLVVYLATIDELTGEITSYGIPLMSFDTRSDGSHDVEWDVERITISAPESFRIVFVAKTGGFYSDVIAIDDVGILDKECDTAFFQVPNYSSLISSYAVEEFSVSHTFYTARPGYRFQIVYYPNGTQAAVDDGITGYMGLYFRLVGGIYDDELEWPFVNQFVRLVLTDQSPNPLTRMNYYYDFLTSNTSNPAYQKPDGVGSLNPKVGYRAFINNERLSTRNYLKHDVAHFSVQVTDMRPYEDSSDAASAQLRNPIIRKRAEPAVSAPKKQPRPEARAYSLQEESLDYELIPIVYDNTENNDDDIEGMISVKSASIIIVATSASVFLFMSLMICLVARSYRKKIKQAPAIMNNINYSYGPTHFENPVKYADRKDIL